jgi:hypothetical protein
MKKNFILGYSFGLFLFFLTSKQNLNLAKMEKIDLRLLKNEIVFLNLNADCYQIFRIQIFAFLRFNNTRIFK